MDVFGPRAMVGVIVVALGLTCFLVSTVQSVPSLLLSFFLLRFLGQVRRP